MSLARTPVTRAPWHHRAAAAVRFAGLRTLFATLDRVAPQQGAARAFDVWCTLPGNAGRRKDHRPGPGEVTRLPLGHGDVVVETWGEADRPVVYLVHGWGGWRGQMGAFVEPLLTTGHRVVAFDAPSHGDALPGVLGPGRGNVMEFLAALDAVAALHGPARGLIGHSLGCAVTAGAVHAGLPADRLVLVAPSPDFEDMTREFGRVLGFGERTRSLLLRTMQDLSGRDLASFDLGPMGADGTMPGTLVVHDRKDKESPYAVGERLADSWPTAALHGTDGLGHQRILTDPGVVARAVRHVRDLVPADPSA